MKRGKIKILLFVLFLAGVYFAFDIYLKYDETGNKLSLIGLKFIPTEYIIEYRYEDGKRTGKTIRHKDKIKLVYYDSLGVVNQEIEGVHDKYPIVKTTYFKSGKVKTVEQLKDTLIHGESKVYNEKGELIESKYFNEGDLVKQKLFESGIEEIYPYLKISKRLEDDKMIFRLNIDHIDLSDFESILFKYDFTDDSEKYYEPRYTEVIDTSEIEVKFKLSSLDEFSHVYGYLEIDGKTHPALSKRINH